MRTSEQSHDDAAGGPPGRRWRTGALVTVFGIVLVAANLRPGVSSVGPVLEDIRVGLGLSGTAVAALTALPILCFGFGALAAPRLSRRIGTDAALAAVMGVLAVGLVVRVGPSVVTLFGGTLLVGVGIAVANVVVPALIKRDFPQRPGLMTGVYVGSMASTAALAAGVTVPVAAALGQGWRGGLVVWTIPAVLAGVYWTVVAVARRGQRAALRAPASLPVSMIREPLAWAVTLFLGLQSLNFYVTLAWLPTVFRGVGISPEEAGVLLGLSILVQVPIALVAPTLAARSRDQRGWAVLVTVLTGGGFTGLLVAPAAAPYLWSLLLGFGQGAAFPVALTLVVLRSRDAADAAQLSAMSQSVGYLLTAAGPLLFGALHDATGGWRLPIGAVLVCVVVQMGAGLAAGRDRQIGDRTPR